MAESSLIDEAPLLAIKAKNETRIRVHWLSVRDDQISRHPQMNDQCQLAIEAYEEILSATVHVLDRLTAKLTSKTASTGGANRGRREHPDLGDAAANNLPA